MWLNSLGANVFGLGLLPQKKMIFLTLTYKKIITVVLVILEIKMNVKYTKSADPETIIHLAAQSLVLSSYVDPVYTYRDKCSRYHKYT